jgi:DNA-binding NarL/FixJ family response regulator
VPQGVGLKEPFLVPSVGLYVAARPAACQGFWRLPLPYNILIADDSQLIREALGRLFRNEEGFEVCGEAENGKEAVAKAQQLHPDLILLDFSMPVMNGLDAARVLKRVMPKVPVIMFSAYSDSSTEKAARSAGVWALVSKFENVSVLLGKAHSALEH